MDILHIHCGDTSGDTLAKSGVPGRVLVWRDPVLDGPLVATGDDAYRRARAEWFAARRYARTREEALAGLERLHATLADAAARADEVVLWFDACLFDQTILIHILERWARWATPRARLSLICIGEHPDVPGFRGLGELNERQLAALFPLRHAVTDAESEAATRAWRALAAPNPEAIENLPDGDLAALPYLANALRRHLQQFPSLRNGLGRLENATLDTLAAAGGACPLDRLFAGVSAREERPYFGDTTLWESLADLTEGPEPPARATGPGSLRRAMWEPPLEADRWTAALTPAGEALRRGERDALAGKAIDRWLGGVHLAGHRTTWRWDETRHRLIRADGA
jgi:hypothetical protein